MNNSAIERKEVKQRNVYERINGRKEKWKNR